MSRKTKRHAPLVRALDLLIELHRRRFGMDMIEIQAHLGLSRREVWRYVRALEDAGVKLEWKKEPLSAPAVWHRLIRLVDIRGYKLVERAFDTQ